MGTVARAVAAQHLHRHCLQCVGNVIHADDGEQGRRRRRNRRDPA